MNQPDKTEALTEISAKQWQFVTQDTLSAKEAVQFLYSGMQTRSFPDNIRDIYGPGEVELLLTQRLYDYAQFLSGRPVQIDSIRRKVRNWLKGANLPTEREDVFQICFALELGELQGRPPPGPAHRAGHPLPGPPGNGLCLLLEAPR